MSRFAGYKHFNLLLDLCFWIVLAGLAFILLEDGGWISGTQPGLNGIAQLFLNLVSLLAHILLWVLIVVRRLRDEYAEQLWQRSAISFAKGAMLFPFVYIMVFFLLERFGLGLDVLRTDPDLQIVPTYYRFKNIQGSIGIHQFEGINFVILRFINHFPLLFAAIYKWHRWRDLRQG